MENDNLLRIAHAHPPVTWPDRNIYHQMGEENIYKMLEDFYLQLEKSKIRFMFQEDMISSSRRSADFFIQILGGPNRYQDKYGSPNLQNRHKPFPIDKEARDIWLNCFYEVLENAEKKYNFPKDQINIFKDFLDIISKWLINK